MTLLIDRRTSKALKQNVQGTVDVFCDNNISENNNIKLFSIQKLQLFNNRIKIPHPPACSSVTFITLKLLGNIH